MPYDSSLSYDSVVPYDSGTSISIHLLGIGSQESFINPQATTVWDDLDVTWNSPTHFWDEAGVLWDDHSATWNSLSAAWDDKGGPAGVLIVRSTGSVSLILTGLPTAESLGVPTIIAHASIGLSGIPSAETFGTPTAKIPFRILLVPITSAEALGHISVPSITVFGIEMARVL